MTSDEAIKVLEDGEWYEALSEWYIVANPERDKLHDAVNMAISALLDQQEQDKPKLLALDQLRRMNGEPVYLVCSSHNIDDGWRICYGGYKSSSGRRYIMFSDDVDYDEKCFVCGDITAYCHKSKEPIE